MTTLTFAFDVELNFDDYIPEGTKVQIYQLKEDSTKIHYNGQIVEYMNVSFKEYNAN